MSSQTRFSNGSTWRIHALAAGAILFLSALIAYTFYIVFKLQDLSSPLLSAVREARLELDTAEMLVDGVLAGEMAYDGEAVWEHLDASIFYLQNLLKSQEPHLAEIGSEFGSETYGRIEKLKEEGKGLKAIVERNMESLDPSNRAEMNIRTHDAFAKVLQEVNGIEESLVDSVLATQRNFRAAHVTLIGLCTLLSVSMFLVLRRHERARIAGYEEMERRVQERTGELSRTNAQLKVEIEEHRRTQNELLRHQSQLREMASQLMETEERERRRIATDIHDRIGQALAIIQIKLGSIRQALQSEESTEEVDEVRRVVSRTIKDTRSLTFEVSPPILYELGLSAAVEWLAEKMQAQHGLNIRVNSDDSDRGLAIGLQVFVFMAVRELLFNTVKHAGAKEVMISINGDRRASKIAVTDDGVGFDPGCLSSNQSSMGFGLFSIKERVRHYGGMMKIESGWETGTRITLSLPRQLPCKQGGRENDQPYQDPYS